MEDASDRRNGALSLNHDDELSGRARSGSASSGHKRSTSGSLLSRLSFLRMIQASQPTPEREHSGIGRDDGSDFSSSLRGGRAMTSALQQRRTRRRRGSLRKTALLGTRLDYRDKKATRTAADVLRGGELTTDQRQQQHHHHHHQPPFISSSDMRPLTDSVPASDGVHLHERREQGRDENTTTWGLMDTQQTTLDPSAPHRRPDITKDNMLGGEVTTDDEDVVSFPRLKNTNAAVAAAAGLHLPPPTAPSDSYYALQADQTYRAAMHRSKTALPTDLASGQEIVWDYSDTEWWGYIILIVTWLVFVVGMGSCFGVWSWAWDVGETPYAPPELEDDPTLPIVGYYPALIILTAVMSWVWVVVAWVGMKYFKHANISGDDI
ncbi:hypothetical protein FE257_005494 [Aspergillus nanangensis]|uniref:Uncharacterized protein n=1 Tax=Aspergillus nanangensis TaxID=2582783 RepID=A0AAD4CA80_ASPNN|nr:hypothetical protein FE257_005494 [Aspergillus nanangensis]